MAADDFERADGDPGANWGNSGEFIRATIVSGTLRPTDMWGLACDVLWTADTFGDDQYSQGVTAYAPAGYNQTGLWVRRSPASNVGGYYIFLESNSVYIRRRNAGTWTELSQALASWNLDGGDLFRAEAVGTNPVVITAYLNGQPVLQAVDQTFRDVGGCPGIYLNGWGALPAFASWEGGEVEAASGSALRFFRGYGLDAGGSW